MKKRLPFIIAAVAVTIFIFSNSLESAAVSSEKSGFFSDILMWILEAFRYSAKEETIVRIVRKSAHILEFAAQGFFITESFGREFLKRLPFVLTLGGLTACVDECIQLFSDGRAAMISDVFIDLSGTVLGFIGGWILFRLAKSLRNARKGTKL